MHEHKHVHGPDCKPKSACEEAMLRIVNNMDRAEALLRSLPWYKVFVRYEVTGYLSALEGVLVMLDQVEHKYNNDNGELN